MNLIITKPYRTTTYILFVFLLLVLSACYTQVDMSSIEKYKSINISDESEVIDNKIIGTWQKTIPWIDGPVQVQQIIFDSNRNCLFKENSERVNGKTLSGSFSTKDSILTIVLEYGYGTEKYYYQVTNGTLTLTPIDMNRHFPYKISGSGGLNWINPDYDKFRF